MLAYALVDEMILAGYDGRSVGVPDGLSGMEERINVLENIRDALGEIRRDDLSEPPSYEEGLALFGKYFPDLWD